MSDDYSVIIPAHNEASVIGRCLSALLDSIDPSSVFVSCNGCDDDTSAIARRFGVNVVETPEASKPAALNAGDCAAGARFPRIYLDADIELTGEDALKLIRPLESDAPLLASPVGQFELSGTSSIVRLFHAAFERASDLRGGKVGNGVYALSAAGRERFGAWPDVTADDLFVSRLFLAREAMNVGDANPVIRPPKTASALVRARSRVYSGNRMLGASHTSPASAKRLIRATRTPRHAFETAVYLAINLVAKAWSRISKGSWERDETARGLNQ
jgi:glycosyltransferase involved in cell wall biosynthesis